MKRRQIMLDKLKELISDQLNVDADSVTPDAKFKEDLEADSLDLFELVMALEEEYGVEIPSEDLENILTVQDIMTYLENKGVEA
jgi:acyl carrier protein